MLDFAIFAATFVAALIIAVIYLYPTSKKTTTIPGLEPTSAEDGNQSDIKKAGSLHEFLCDLHGQFGPIASFWLGRQFMVSIASPSLFKQQQNIFDRPPALFKMFEPLITKHSIQYANKGEGRRRRKVYDECYSAASIRHYYSCIQEVTNNLIANWTTLIDADHIPLSEHIMPLAIKSIILINFGKDTLKDAKIEEIHHSYDILWSDMECSLTEGLPTPGSDREILFNKEYAKIREMVEDALDSRSKLSSKGDNSDLFVDVLFRSGFDSNVAFPDALSYMIGGFHTTGNLLIWAIYFLASHPDIQTRAAEEVKVHLQGEDVDHENVDSLSYLRQIVDETLRCAVIAPYAARFQDCDSQLDGHVIPKETPVIQALGVVLQDENLWPHPNRFDPDRFTTENINSRPSLAFQPFGFAGKRKCPGYRLAYAEAITVLAMILRKFSITLVEGQVVTPVFGLVCHPADEIWIKISERHSVKQ